MASPTRGRAGFRGAGGIRRMQPRVQTIYMTLQMQPRCDEVECFWTSRHNSDFTAETMRTRPDLAPTQPEAESQRRLYPPNLVSPSARLSASPSSAAGARGASQYIGVRQYQRGDSLNVVVWPPPLGQTASDRIGLDWDTSEDSVG